MALTTTDDVLAQDVALPTSRTISTTAPLTGGGDLSANRTLAISDLVGDSGAGGTKGAVPAPAAGDTAAGKFLKADATWAVPPVTNDVNGANGELAAVSYSTELITLDTGAGFTDSSANLLPADAEILGVVARVTTTITTATDWALGDATTAARFAAANATLTAGTTTVGLAHRKGGVSTDATGPVQTAAAKLRITTTGTPGAGAVRVTVFYRRFTAPSA